MKKICIVATLLLGCHAMAMTGEQIVDCFKTGGNEPRSNVCQNAITNFYDVDVEVREAASRYGIEPALLHAVIAIESNFNPKARSGAGAMGLTQVMPRTGADLGYRADQLHTPKHNLDAGARYLSQMWELFNDWSLTLAAYNAGPGAVQKYRGIPPYPETQNYVKNVLAVYVEFRPFNQLSKK